LNKEPETLKLKKINLSPFLIGSEKIDHGADMNKLLSQFDDWEQLQ